MKRIALGSIALLGMVALAFVAGAYLWPKGRADNAANRAQDASPLVHIALAAPQLQAGDAFPASTAGISAYIHTDTEVDLSAITSVFTQQHFKGEEHVIGQVVGLNAKPIQLYADVNGWMVAYYLAGEPSSRAAMWSGTYDQMSLDSETGALEEVLRRAAEANGDDFPALWENAGIYHWQHPDATMLTVFSKLQIYPNLGYYHFQIPNAATVYEASLTGYGASRHEVRIDGTLVIDINEFSNGKAVRREGVVSNALVAPGKAHTITNGTAAGSAFYLVWRNGP